MKFWYIPGTASSADDQSLQGITDIAVDKTGAVAVVMNFSSDITLFDPVGGTFTAVSTPAGEQPVSVAALAAGGFAVGSSGRRGAGGSIIWMSADGQTRGQSSAAGFYLSPTASGVLASGGNLYRAAPGVSTTVIAHGTTRVQDPNGLDLNAPVAVAPNGTIVATSNSGLAMLGPAGQIEQTLTLPGFDCSAASGQGVRTETPGVTCAQVAKPIAVDSAGSVFFFTSGPSLAFEELPASTSLATAS